MVGDEQLDPNVPLSNYDLTFDFRDLGIDGVDGGAVDSKLSDAEGFEDKPGGVAAV